MVEHQLPKLRAAGSNPVFRSKANLRMMQIIRFFCARTEPLQTCLHKGLDGHKKGCAQHNGLLSGAPAVSGTGMHSPPGRAKSPAVSGTGMHSPPGRAKSPAVSGTGMHSPPSKTVAHQKCATDPSEGFLCATRNIPLRVAQLTHVRDTFEWDSVRHRLE